MENYRRSSHTVHHLKFHVVWITKFRKPVLGGEVAVRLRQLVREICNANDVEIIKGHISRGHFHLFVPPPARISVSDLLKWIKGKTSCELFMEFRTLSRQIWSCPLWASGYFGVSSGKVTDEVIMK
jgi:putative transposase